MWREKKESHDDDMDDFSRCGKGGGKGRAWMHGFFFGKGFAKGHGKGSAPGHHHGPHHRGGPLVRKLVQLSGIEWEDAHEIIHGAKHGDEEMREKLAEAISSSSDESSTSGTSSGSSSSSSSSEDEEKHEHHRAQRHKKIMQALKLLAAGDEDEFHTAMHELHQHRRHHGGKGHGGKGHGGKGLGSMRGMFQRHGGKGACKGKGKGKGCHDKCMKKNKSGRGSKKEETCTTDQGDDFKETFTVVEAPLQRTDVVEPVEDEPVEDDLYEELAQDDQEDETLEDEEEAAAEAEAATFHDSRFVENISQLLAMGFNEDEAQSALEACDDNVDDAIAMLLCDW